MEESAELIQAINKYWRKQLKCGERTILEVPIGTPEEEHIKEEIADVIICIEQLKYLLSVKDVEINEIIQQKLERQIRWIKEKSKIN